MTYYTSRFLLPEDSDDVAEVAMSQKFIRRMDAIHRDTQAPLAAQTGLFVAGARRKQLFH